MIAPSSVEAAARGGEQGRPVHILRAVGQAHDRLLEQRGPERHHPSDEKGEADGGKERSGVTPLGIDWPDLPVEVSKRDATAPRLAEIANGLPFAHAG